MNKFFKKFSTIQLIVISYILIILTGSILLTLPISTISGNGTSFIDALFTATSATSITGLIVFDTNTYWSIFGQIIILLLIQIGGIGSITLITTIMMISKQKIGLNQRIMMQDAISAPQIGGIINLTKFIILGTLLFETIGAILLSFSFIPTFGIGKGIYMSIFHSISAFCNAGFDIMGNENNQFISLMNYASNWYVSCIIMSLIFLGGLGFFVWKDIFNKKKNIKTFSIQTKIVLSVSIFLIIIGTLLFFIFDFNNPDFKNLPIGEKILNSLFQSVSARTAGFASVDLAKTSESSQLLTIILMFIGGSTGSTAGGIKTTTFAILCLSIITTFKRKKDIQVFNRRIEENIIYTATTIFMIFIILISISSMIISFIENIPILTVIFECTSAITNTGLTLGITSNIGIISKIILALLMFFGRAGSITLLLSFSSETKYNDSKYPIEKIQVG